MSNYATPPQLVENVPYRDLREMHDFARKWRDEHRGKWFTARKLSGFCLLMKRVVYEKIGGLDERFGLGFFDDDDLAERARRAGFDLAVAQDLFVHHFGSRTFSGNGVDAGKLLDENARRFAAKWGLKETNRKPVMLLPWRGAENGDSPPRKTGLRQQPGTSPTLTRSVCFDVALFALSPRRGNHKTAQGNALGKIGWPPIPCPVRAKQSLLIQTMRPSNRLLCGT